MTSRNRAVHLWFETCERGLLLVSHLEIYFLMVKRLWVEVVHRRLIIVLLDDVRVILPPSRIQFSLLTFLELYIDILEERLPLSALHFFVPVEQPCHDLGVLELDVIQLVRRACFFFDFCNVLLDLLNLLLEGLLLRVDNVVAFLESHSLLVQIDAKCDPKHTDQSLHHIQEQLAVSDQDVVSGIPVLNIVFLLQNLEICANHSVDRGRVVLELLVERS